MKKKIVFIAIIIFALSAIGYVSIYAISGANQLGREYRGLAEDNSILASVDKINITRLDIEQFKVRQRLMVEIADTGFDTEYNNSWTTDEVVLQHLIEDHVLYLEAVEKDLAISDKDTQDNISIIKKVIKEKNSQDIQVFYDYISGCGMTVDQYFDSCFSIYKEALSIGKLRGTILKDIADSDMRASTWSQYRADLVQKYQSQISIAK